LKSPTTDTRDDGDFVETDFQKDDISGKGFVTSLPPILPNARYVYSRFKYSTNSSQILQNNILLYYSNITSYIINFYFNRIEIET